MRDEQIIDLYWARSQDAIRETQDKYGRYCHSIAWHILEDEQDCQECINDTWMRAWNAMPEARPDRLPVFLGKITRNLSLDRWKHDRAIKRGFGQTALALEELAECIPDRQSVEQAADQLVLIVAGALAIVRQLGLGGQGSPDHGTHKTGEILLSERSQKVTVEYTDHAPAVSTIADLQWFSEKELFGNWDTAIFLGTVQSIDNIVLDFNGEKDYKALMEIQVEQVYRGEVMSGETIQILLPCSFGDNTWREDTSVISQLDVGMRGIFMPKLYGEDSICSMNGATLYYQDLAAYGLLDGERFAFLETEQGLVFDRSAYESISDAQTLEDIQAYVLGMIGK